MTIFTLLSAALLMAATETVPADFYVSPTGNDTAPGTAAAPFATLEHARQAVGERVRAGLDRNLRVAVRGGVYELNEPLVFGPEDGGTTEFSVTYAAYPGEQPVISGGRQISGWTRGDNDLWTVELPEVRSGAWFFRQLFVDGVRLPRGRYPNAPELLRVASVSPDVTEITFEQEMDFGDLGGKDVELVIYQNWSISRDIVTALDGPKVRTRNPMGWIGHGWTTTSPHKPAYLEHALAFVDQPGEWHLDRRTGILTYKAAPGENPNARRFVAPRLEQLLVAAGRSGAPVRNLRFEGLTFEYAEWPLPAFGYMGIQAGHYGTIMQEQIHVLPLTLAYIYAEGCSLERCRILRVGACGIGFEAGCRDNHVVGCEVADIGGNGIMVGWRGKGVGMEGIGNPNLSADWHKPEIEAPRGNVIMNNYVHRCGAINHGTVGIFVAFSADTRITHNLVTDLPYTGISAGFRWNQTPTSQRTCLIERNHVFDVMQMLADGGAIYTLGLQPGTVLRGNLLHTVHRSAYAHGGAPNNGVFFDEGSTGCLVEDNIIYDTSGEPIRFHKTQRENLEWGENSFGAPPDDPAFPTTIAQQAGIEAEYRDILPDALR
ncbi:MAG: right-handed parallel beta-helix repeat-containing protein [Phycisphaerales bacterium]|nr:right-handed parallel beta-helix repeat-containing protein [Phycisphaerales bacterium]